MRVISARFVKTGVRVADCPSDGHPAIAVAGRSNVGKSSLLNTLTGERGLARISRRPGKTQALQFYLLNETFYLVDLPGYGYAAAPASVRQTWGPLIEGYLRRQPPPRGCLVLLDLRHPPSPRDLQMKAWLEAERIQTVYIATKADQVTSSRCPAHLATLRAGLRLSGRARLIPFSAKTGEGRCEVWNAVSALMA